MPGWEARGGAWEGEPERGKGRGREAECDKGINRQANRLHRATSAFGFAFALALASVVGVGIGVVVGVVPGVVAGVMAVIGVVGGTGDDLALALVLGFFTGDGLSSELMRLKILFFGGIGYGGMSRRRAQPTLGPTRLQHGKECARQTMQTRNPVFSKGRNHRTGELIKMQHHLSRTLRTQHGLIIS